MDKSKSKPNAKVNALAKSVSNSVLKKIAPKKAEGFSQSAGNLVNIQNAAGTSRDERVQHDNVKNEWYSNKAQLIEILNSDKFEKSMVVDMFVLVMQNAISLSEILVKCNDPDTKQMYEMYNQEVGMFDIEKYLEGHLDVKPPASYVEAKTPIAPYKKNHWVQHSLIQDTVPMDISVKADQSNNARHADFEAERVMQERLDRVEQELRDRYVRPIECEVRYGDRNVNGDYGNRAFKIDTNTPIFGKEKVTIDEWIFKFENACIMARIPVEYYLRLAVNYTVGLSQQLVKQSISTMGSWMHCKQELMNAFTPPDRIRSLRMKLLNLKHTGSFEKYAQEFQHLTSLLEIGDCEKLDIFVMGLNDKTRQLMALNEPRTFNNALTLAARINSAETAVHSANYAGRKQDHKDKKCNYCGKMGHIERNCNTKKYVEKKKVSDKNSYNDKKSKKDSGYQNGKGKNKAFTDKKSDD